MKLHKKFMAPLAVLSLLFASGCGFNAATVGNKDAVPKPATSAAAEADDNPSGIHNPAHGGNGSASSDATTPANASRGAADEQPAQFQIQTMLTDVHLLGAKLGYAWGVTNQELRLYRTEDGGINWAAVFPKLDGKPFTSSPQDNSSMFFLDREHLWVYQAAQNEDKPLLFRTADGGKTWSSTELPVTARSTGISFIDPHNGWMLTSSDAAMGKSEKSLYRTTDGGATWNRIMENTGYLPTQNPTPQAIPQSGHSRGISFRDASNGFVPLESIEGKLTLYGTSDGGLTWAEVALPTLEPKEGTSYSITAAPEFWGANRMQGWFPIVIREDDNQHYAAFFTADGGRTWTYAALHTKPTTASDAAAITFVNDQDGWSLANGQFSHTTDRGATWRPVANDPVITEAFKAFPYAAKMQFIENGTGWLLLKSDDASASQQSRLLQTLDGGKSWKVL
jgi:photosystem II stability/assembly factor-like uncharacterized protein